MSVLLPGGDQVFTDDSLITPEGDIESDWIDIGKSRPEMQVYREAAGGAYGLEVDWSSDGGATTDSTDTIETVEGEITAIPGKARWAKIRVLNTDGADDFTDHVTLVAKDRGAGRGR